MQILKNNSTIKRNRKSFLSEGIRIRNLSFTKQTSFKVISSYLKTLSHGLIVYYFQTTYIRCSNGFCKIHKATDFLGIMRHCWSYPQSFPKPSYPQEFTFLEGKHKLSCFFFNCWRLKRAFEMKSWLTLYIKKRISCFFAHSSSYSPWRKLLNTAGMC